MVSLLAESFGNTIKTKGALKFNSNVKKLLSALSENKFKTLGAIFATSPNINFKERYTDMMNTLDISPTVKTILAVNGYNETAMNMYNCEHWNCIDEVEEIPCLRNKAKNIRSEFEFNFEDESGFLSYHNDENFIIFFPSDGNAVKYFYKAPEGVAIEDFKIDSDLFIHMLYTREGETFYLKTHCGLSFIELNADITEIDLKKCYCNIKLDKRYCKITDISDNCITLLDEDLSVFEITFGKKYFFIHGGVIYFNITSSMEKYRESFKLDTDIQLNNLNQYNYLNIFGLNDYLPDGVYKISSYDGDEFKNVFRYRFSNTLNGGINFFNGKTLPKEYKGSSLYKSLENKDKDYCVDIDDEYFSISGNFFYNGGEKGEYKLEILYTPGGASDIEVALFKIQDGISTCVKIVKPNLGKYNIFYFCNLEFVFKKRYFTEYKFTYFISCKDIYPFIELEGKYQFKKIHNEEEITKFVSDSGSINIGKCNSIKSYFDGKSIVFENSFSYSENKWFFSNSEITLHPGQSFDTKDKKYIAIGQYTEKGSSIIARGKVVINYTNKPTASFSLVNDKGYITEFWVNNQGKTLYFKLENDNITYSEEASYCDFWCRIPDIDEYINVNKTGIGDIFVSDTDYFEVEFENSNKLLITEKFLNVPLFHKVYIKGEHEDVSIYSADGEQVSEFIIDNVESGIVVYFNAKPGKTYYYNTDIEEYQYFVPVKSFENIEEDFIPNEDGRIIMNNPVKFTNIKVDAAVSSEPIVLYLYNTEEEKTTRIEFENEDLGKVFELTMEVDRVTVECKSINVKDIVVSNVISKSFIHRNKLVYIKDERDSIVYSSEEVETSASGITFTKLKVGSRYKINNGKLEESSKGIFEISAPISGEIVVNSYNYATHYECEITSYHSVGYDEFYENNFKSPGAFYSGEPIEFIKLADTSNYLFTSKDMAGEINEEG